MNISASSYTILQQKVNLHTAGCGRLNTPSGVTVTPKRMKANTIATRPLKQKKLASLMTYTMHLYNAWMGTTDFQWPRSVMLKCLYLTKPAFTRLFHYRLCHSLAPGQYMSWRNHTPWSRVLLEKLSGSADSQEIPRIYGTQRFITAFTNGHHLSLSWASLIQSIPPHPTSLRSILILPSHLCLGLPSGLSPSGFFTKILCMLLFLEEIMDIILQ